MKNVVKFYPYSYTAISQRTMVSLVRITQRPQIIVEKLVLSHFALRVTVMEYVVHTLFQKSFLATL